MAFRAADVLSGALSVGLGAAAVGRKAPAPVFESNPVKVSVSPGDNKLDSKANGRFSGGL